MRPLGAEVLSVATFFSNGEFEAELLEQVAAEVHAVERELTLQVASKVQLVEDVGRLTLEAGGKRLRPAFVSLSARATGLPYDADRTTKLGACMEMIHMATLIHADVIDNADTRRGKRTASAIYGNTGSILSGDALLAKAMVMLAMDGDLEIIRNVSASVVEMAEGEVRELATRYDFDLDETEHLEVLRMKTAAFIQSCCEIGAIVAGAPLNQRIALKTYGYHIGMAFQIVDDLLDYRGDKERTGKPQATDFREGCATLPLIYLRPLLSDKEREVARGKFGNGVTDEELLMICDWMHRRGAFDKANETAAMHIDKAIVELQKLPDSSARRMLKCAAEFVMAREA